MEKIHTNIIQKMYKYFYNTNRFYTYIKISATRTNKISVKSIIKLIV